jgi:hypothetical protein
MMYDDIDDGYDYDYRIPPRHDFGRQMSGQPCRYMQISSRWRGCPRRILEEVETEIDIDECEDDHDFEDGLESLFFRQLPRLRLRDNY